MSDEASVLQIKSAENYDFFGQKTGPQDKCWWSGSAKDPHFLGPWIRIQILQMLTLINFWENFELFRQLFFFNPSSSSKVVDIFVMGPKFLGQKLEFYSCFDDVTLILMMESAQNLDFWTKSTQLCWLISFELVDGFSNFKK